MPRKLLRVALVAAVIPALTPVLSLAETGKPITTARPTASTPAPKQNSLSWWQRLRGQKAPAGTKALPSTKLPPGAKAGPSAAAANKSMLSPATKVAAASRAESQSRIKRVSSEVPSLGTSAKAEHPEELLNRPLITPASQPTAADFENAFPDDTRTTRRGRPEVVPQAEIAAPFQEEVATPVVQTEVATPVESVATPSINQQQPAAEALSPVGQLEPQIEAFPIDQAAPPQDLNAGYNEPQGTSPQYDHVGMLQQGAPANDARFVSPVPARPIANAMNGMNGMTASGPAKVAPVAVPGGPVGFVRVDSGLYPSPQPYIPFDVGTTMITNPALDPHEMLYAHRYRGLYGPFYHKTYRHWVLTPFGVCKNEKRVLVGTEVRVNYKSHICPWSLFFPPVTN